MKKLLVLAIPVLAFSLINAQENSLEVNAANAETTLKEENVYKVDFEKFELGTGSNELYSQTGLFWFNTNGATPEVVEHAGSKALKYTFTGNEASVGGLGQGDIGNLSKLVNGQKYEFSAKVDILSMADNGELYFEYQKSDWTGVKLTKNGVSNLNGGSTSDVSYENGILKFSFTAAPWFEDASKSAWLKITAVNFTAGNQVVVDDVKFTKHVARTHTLDFENEAVGDAAPASAASAIDKIYNADAESITIKEENGNKYLSFTGTNPGADKWAKFYINNLWSMTSGEKYRLEFDVLHNTSAEWYLCYNESGESTATYNATGLLGISNTNNDMLASTFDGKHLTIDFVPSTATSEQFFQQMCFVVKYNTDCVFDIDNVTVTHFDDVNTAISAKATTNTLYVGQELDTSVYGFELAKLSERTRPLESNEYTVDTSAVNKNEPGTYPVTITVVDEFKNVLTKEVSVTYVADNVTGLTIKTAPAKLVYNYNDPIDLTGLVVSQTYESGKVVDADVSKLEVSGYNPNQVGKQTVTLTGENGKTVTYEVEVLDVLESISVKTQPTKTTYYVGETLDIAGLSVEKVMASGAKEEITVDRGMVSGFDSSKEGTTTVTITFEGKTATFELTVQAKPEEKPSDEPSEEPSTTPSTEPSDEPTEEPTEPKKGCKGSTAGAISLVSLLGLVFLRKRNRK